MFACCWANSLRCSMGACIPRCGSIVGIGLPKIISAGDGSPVSVGVARKFNSVSCMSSPFLIVFRIIGLTCHTCLSINPLHLG